MRGIVYTIIMILLTNSAFAKAEKARAYTLKDREFGSNLSTFVSVFEDKKANRSFRSIQNLPAEKFIVNNKQSLGFGYQKSAMWLKFQLANPGEEDRNLALSIDYPLLDRIEFYYEAEDGFQKITSGDTEDIEKRWLKYRNFAFPFSIAAQSEITLYLRVQSTSTVTIPLQIWEADEIRDHVADEGPAFGLYFGCMIGILLYNMFIFASTRSRTYASYVCFLTGSIFFYLAWTGLGPLYLWSDFPWLVQRAWPIFGAYSALFVLVFQYFFLGIPNVLPKLSRIYLYIIALAAIGLFVNPLLPLDLAHRVSFFTGGVLCSVAYFVAIYLSLKKHRQAVYYLVAWTAFLIFIISGSLTVLGVIPLPLAIGTFGSQIGSGLEAILLSLGLADRINIMKKRELEQSQKIIDNFGKIEVLKERLETVLKASKEMALVLEAEEVLLVASRHIQKRLESLSIQAIYHMRELKEQKPPFLVNTLWQTKNHDIDFQDKWLYSRKILHFNTTLVIPIFWKDKSFGCFVAAHEHSEEELEIEDVWFIETLIQSLALTLQNTYYQNNLRALVDERTNKLNKALNALTDRQRKIDDILHNIEQGIFTIDADLKIGEEHSHRLLDLFAIDKNELHRETLAELLFRDTKTNEEVKSTVLEALKASVDIPESLWDVNSHHLPQELLKQKGNRLQVIELEWKPLTKSDKIIDQIMVVAKDVSERRKLEEKLRLEEAHHKDFMGIVGQILKTPRRSLHSYFEEMQSSFQFLEQLRQDSLPRELFLQKLHSMKGLTRSVKFPLLSNDIHQLEGIIVSLVEARDTDNSPILEGFEKLKKHFQEYLLVFDQIYGNESSLLSESWNLMSFVAQSLPEKLEMLAKIGYPVGQIYCNDGVLIWRKEIVSTLREILTLLFSNAIDHGFVLPFQDSQDKRPVEISFQAQLSAHAVLISIEDRGAGIDLEKLMRRAREKGIDFDPEKAEELIFAEGLSTADQVSLSSGRGVGLSAVRNKVLGLSGQIRVETNQAGGTSFHLFLPRALVTGEMDLDLQFDLSAS